MLSLIRVVGAPSISRVLGRSATMRTGGMVCSTRLVLPAVPIRNSQLPGWIAPAFAIGAVNKDRQCSPAREHTPIPWAG